MRDEVQVASGPIARLHHLRVLKSRMPDELVARMLLVASNIHHHVRWRRLVHGLRRWRVLELVGRLSRVVLLLLLLLLTIGALVLLLVSVGRRLERHQRGWLELALVLRGRVRVRLVVGRARRVHCKCVALIARVYGFGW